MAIALDAGSGRADEIPGISLSWIAPPTCPSTAELRTRIRRLLPADSAETSTDRLLAEGTVQYVNGQYRLELSLGRERDSSRVTRVLQSDSCESLAGAAAVTLALLARSASAEPSRDGGATARASVAPTSAPTAETTMRAVPSEPPGTHPPPPRETTRQSREATPQAPDETVEPTLPSTQRRWAPAVGPLVATDEGVLPSWSYGLGLGIGLHVSRVRVILTGVLWLPQNGSATGGQYSGRYERRSGALSSCYAWPVGRFDLGPCLRLTVEDVTAKGSGPDVIGELGHADWLTVGIGARAGWSIRRWAGVFLRPSLALTTSRPGFAIDGVGPLYKIPLISAGVDLGCEWIL